MRRDPTGVTARLVVELAPEADSSSLAAAVDEAGGEVVRELPFDCWLVSLPEAAVDDLCSLSGVVRIETEATLERSVDETVQATDDDTPDVPDAGDREV